MSEPKAADTKPKVLKVEPGTYWWCACGRSDDQPFCDGSHAGTDFRPMKVEVDEAMASRPIAFCACKQTDDGFRCDGSHAKL